MDHTHLRTWRNDCLSPLDDLLTTHRPPQFRARGKAGILDRATVQSNFTRSRLILELRISITLAGCPRYLGSALLAVGDLRRHVCELFAVQYSTAVCLGRYRLSVCRDVYL